MFNSNVLYLIYFNNSILYFLNLYILTIFTKIIIMDNNDNDIKNKNLTELVNINLTPFTLGESLTILYWIIFKIEKAFELNNKIKIGFNAYSAYKDIKNNTNNNKI